MDQVWLTGNKNKTDLGSQNITGFHKSFLGNPQSETYTDF